MAADKQIIVQPLISEKSEILTNDENKYIFIVHKRANKIEIRKAVEAMFNVTVESVNTAIMPRKAKSRYSRSGLSKGNKPAFKKAYITLSPGEEIDFYGEI